MAKAVRRIYVGEENKATLLSFLPVGFMCMWPSTALPKVGTWMERDGSILAIADYPELFLILGNQYGGEAGSTFALPDDRGLVERGWDHGRRFDANRVFGSQQGDAIRNIYGNADYIFTSNYPVATVGAFSWLFLGGNRGAANLVAGNAADNLRFDASSIVPTAAENRMKNRAYLPIIKVA